MFSAFFIVDVIILDSWIIQQPCIIIELTKSWREDDKLLVGLGTRIMSKIRTILHLKFDIGLQ
jgi:hypothetical protein